MRQNKNVGNFGTMLSWQSFSLNMNISTKELSSDFCKNKSHLFTVLYTTKAPATRRWFAHVLSLEQPNRVLLACKISGPTTSNDSKTCDGHGCLRNLRFCHKTSKQKVSLNSFSRYRYVAIFHGDVHPHSMFHLHKQKLHEKRLRSKYSTTGYRYTSIFSRSMFQ